MRHEKNAAVARLRALLAMVELRAFPTVIAVASATRDDDTPAIAAALSRLGAQTGRRIGVLSLDGTRRNECALPVPASAMALEVALASWRTDYDAVIVSAGATLENALRAHAVGLADGIVLAICADRSVSVADHDLGLLITQVHGTVFGAVMTGCAPRLEAGAGQVKATDAKPSAVRRALDRSLEMFS